MSRAGLVCRLGSGALWSAVAWVAGAAALGAPGSLAAQQTPPPGAPPTQQEQPVDSARLRALERLKMLGRRPGADSALFVQDSLARAAAESRPGSSQSAPDSVLAELFDMPGYSLTTYEAAKAQFDAKGRVLVLGAAEEQRAHVTREGMDVQADTSITYSERSGRIRTVGASTFTPPQGDAVESQGLVYDMKEGIGSSRDAKTAYQQQGATWYVSGDMPLAAQDSMYMSHARFTSCDLTVPHYHFETDQIKIVGGKVLIARPVRLYFADVPVAWLPFIAQSLSSGRASGILTPTFSVNDIVRNSTGYQRRISNLGFYWAMSQYSDAIVAFDWFSDNYLSLTGQFQYRISRLFLNGDLNVRRYWRENGRTEFAIDTRHSWDVDERTSLRLSGRYVTSTEFVEQNSFNPAEVTQSINSEGGLNRRFGWGTMSVSANRQQYLSDKRVTMTLPAANINLSTITLFRAPENQAHFWNNMTWGGGASFQRQTLTRLQPDTFSVGTADTEDQTAQMNSSLSLGNVSFSQSVGLTKGTTLGVPELLLENPDTTVLSDAGPIRSVNDQDLNWNLGVSYQQHLVGSTTITPSLSFTGSAFQSDTSTVASNFLPKPSRMSLSASLKTDIYGFWPGFGGFQIIRHKFSPTFSYSWTPQVTPTAQQITFFGAEAQQPKQILNIGINNTWEAKRKEKPDTTAADSATIARAAAVADTATGPRAVETTPTVQILGLTTGVVKYDFVRRDTLNSFLAGFGTTILTNQISSDYLQGLTISMAHDLFADSLDGGRLVRRTFAPHLAQLNLGFSLGSRSRIFRLLGLSGKGEGGNEVAPEPEPDTTAVEYTSRGVDEQSIIPGGRGSRSPADFGAGRRGGSGWNAQLSYSLTRPRSAAAPENQMVSASLTLHPTEAWDMSWRTSYDIVQHAFNDHFIRLTRNLHRWEANFDFVKTATGNWQFRFEVSLTDNRDLKFDYQQHQLQSQNTTQSQRNPTIGR